MKEDLAVPFWILIVQDGITSHSGVILYCFIYLQGNGFSFLLCMWQQNIVKVK